MRPRRHWTPRYLVDRTRLAIRQRRHPSEPWLTADAVELLDQLLKPADVCFEWGAGRSTWWLAARANRVVSVEHNPEWHARVSRDVRALAHVTVHLAPPEECSYVAPFNLEDIDFDVVLVDGLFRDACAVAALERLSPGGLLVIDNVERHLPSRSRGPDAIGDKYESDRWKSFDSRTSHWRRVWTSDGVTDTAIFFVP